MALRVFYSFSGKDEGFATLLYDRVIRSLNMRNEIWDYNYKIVTGIEEYKNRRWPDHLIESRSANVIIMLVSEDWTLSDQCKQEYKNFCQYKKFPRAYSTIFFDESCNELWQEFAREPNPILSETKRIDQPIIENYDFVSVTELLKNDLFREMVKKIKDELINLRNNYRDSIVEDESNYYIVSTYYATAEKKAKPLEYQQIRYQSYLIGYLSNKYKNAILAPSSIGIERIIDKDDYNYMVREENYIKKCKNLIIIHDNSDKDGNLSILDKYKTDSEGKTKVCLLRKPDNWNSFQDKDGIEHYVTIVEINHKKIVKVIKEKTEKYILEVKNSNDSGIDLTEVKSDLKTLDDFLDMRYSNGNPEEIFKYFYLYNEKNDDREIKIMKEVYTKGRIETEEEAFVLIKFLSHDVITENEFNSVVGKKKEIKEVFNSLTELDEFKLELRIRIIESISITFEGREGQVLSGLINNDVAATLKEVFLFNRAVK